MTIKIQDIIHCRDYRNFDRDGTFDFEVKSPAGRVYCITYNFINGNLFDADCYRLDHVWKWQDPDINDPEFENTGIESSLEETNQDLIDTGYVVIDAFRAELEKNWQWMQEARGSGFAMN